MFLMQVLRIKDDRIKQMEIGCGCVLKFIHNLLDSDSIGALAHGTLSLATDDLLHGLETSSLVSNYNGGHYTLISSHHMCVPG